jgi:hypothetical protein
MAEGYVERVAGELADLALADEQATKDEKIVNEIGEILGSSSQTLQEAFLTAVRVRRAEERARALLAERAAKPIRVKSRLLTDGDEPASADDIANDAIQMGSGTSDTPPEDPQAPPTPQSEEDAAFADVLNTLDEFLQTDDGTAADEEAKPVITPSRATRG